MTDLKISEHRKKFGISEALQNFWVDILLLIAFVLDMNYHFTGVAIHEWLGVALAISVIVHLLLHWKWIVAVLKRIFSKLVGVQRIKMMINILLFLDIVIIIMTGILISKVVVPFFGIRLGEDMAWRSLHGQAAKWMIYLIGLHLAFSWKWIVNMFKKLFTFKRRKQSISKEIPTPGELA